MVTLTRYKASLGGSADASTPSVNDQQYLTAITAASSLVRSYTSLRFELSENTPPSDRQFEYDGSGFLDIDEAVAVNSVSQTGGYEGAQTWNLSSYNWGAYPLNSPVKFWLQLPQDFVSGAISPEMGFTYNLDTLWYKYAQRPSIVTVNANWGWPKIPEDVQQAVVWTAQHISGTNEPYTSKSIEGYSVTRGAMDDGDSLPDRVKAALAPYIIPRV